MGLNRTRAFLAGAIIGAGCVVASASNAMAQTSSELERGRNLFGQALSMEVAGDWAGALARLESVARIKMTPQVRFHLARCKEQLGRLTEALGDYRLAEYEATKLNLPELSEMTRARQDLESRVPKIEVSLSPNLRNSTVELDGIALGVLGSGQRIPLNPGTHQLVVHTPDGQSFVKLVSVAEGSVESVQLEEPPGFVQRSSRATAPQPPRDTIEPGPSARSPAWAWIAGGVGAAGLVSASVLWYVREKAIDDLNNGCQNNVCPTNLRSTQTRGEQASIAAPLALGVGVLGLAIATYGFVAAPKKTSTNAGSYAKLRFNVGCDSRFAGVNVAGAF